MTPANERLEILEMIRRGTISSEEGLKLIEALGEEWEEESSVSPSSEGENDEILDHTSGFDEDFSKWRSRWTIPFWIGVGFTTLGGALMYLGWSAHGFGPGFFLAWIPFLIGVGTMTLGWNSKTGPWVHIRIQQQPGEKPEQIAISIPIPIRFLAWGIRNFGNFIKGLDATGLDEIILALEQSSPDDVPLSVNISDDEDGNQVKVFIG
jgi:hypothetical protein